LFQLSTVGSLHTEMPRKSRCAHCRRTYHSLFAEGETTKKTVNQTPGTDDSKTQSVANTSSVAGSAMVAHVQTVRAEAPYAFNVLLTTAWINLYTAEGRRVKVRAFLDEGATVSFISESLCQTLRIKRQRIDIPISALEENIVVM